MKRRAIVCLGIHVRARHGMLAEFSESAEWRLRWRRGDFPTSYDALRQSHVTTEFYRLALEAEGVPGGATLSHELSESLGFARKTQHRAAA